jgi:hypothetical protein
MNRICFSFTSIYVANCELIISPLICLIVAGLLRFLLIKLTSPRFVLVPGFNFVTTVFWLANTNSMLEVDPSIQFDLADFLLLRIFLSLAFLCVVCILGASLLSAFILLHFSVTDMTSNACLSKGHDLRKSIFVVFIFTLSIRTCTLIHLITIIALHLS